MTDHHVVHGDDHQLDATAASLMGSDHPVRTIGQDGFEQLDGQHAATLSVEL